MKKQRSLRDWLILIAQKVYEWVKKKVANRRLMARITALATAAGSTSARAIIANRQLLARSVGAMALVGTMVVGAIVATNVDGRLDSVEAKVNRIAEQQLRQLGTDVRTLQSEIDRLDRESTKQIESLAEDLADITLVVNSLGELATTLPSGSRFDELVSQISSLSALAQDTASTAQQALETASNATDKEARAAAAEASSKASDALAAAVEAQEHAADAAMAKAAEALAAADAARDKAEEAQNGVDEAKAAADAAQAQADAASEGVLEAQAAADAARARAEAAAVAAAEAEARAAAAEEKADAAAATAEDLSGLVPHAIVMNQVIIGDGQTVVRDAGTLKVKEPGAYSVQWAVQDGYGCNGDPIVLLLNGVAKASWTTTYGSCAQQFRSHSFNVAEAGDYAVSVSIGCKPPGNGQCRVNVLANISRAR